MNTYNFSRASLVLFGALALSAGSAFAKIHPTAAQTARTTLDDVRFLAKDAAEHADIYGREVRVGQLTNEDQADHIEAIRADINRMGKDVALLEAERPNLAPWEKEALDQVEPELELAATNTAQAIDYFNAHGRGSWTVENQQTIHRLTDETKTIEATAKDYLKLEALREREAKVVRDLPAPVN